MSESKHAPGPWAIPGANVFRVFALKDGQPFRCIVDSTTPENAYFGRDNLGWPVSIDDMENLRLGREAAANARLIAASPDLYSALKALLKACSDHHWGGKPIDTSFLADAHDAIAKAEGRP